MGSVNTKFLTAAAVADYNTSHYWEFPEFQPGIVDFLNRKVSILPRISTTPATGQPSRYKEQTKLPSNARFANPRTGVKDGSYALESINADYGRVERAAYLKCMVSQITYSMFDKELVAQQGNEVALLKKDFDDMLIDFARVQNNAIWNGSGTSADDSTSLDYAGVLNQVSKKIAIATPYDFTTKQGTMITDQIRAQIAASLADTTYDVFPTAVYLNPVTIERIIDEERSREGVRQVIPNSMELANGWKVSTINTAIGNLPLIPDPYIKLDTTTTAGKTIHTIAVVNEPLIERHYLTTPMPRVFKMSTDANLIDDYIAILFDAIVVKGADKAHFQLKLTI